MTEPGGEEIVSCSDHCTCPGHTVCTRDWNRGIVYQLKIIGNDGEFGHCIDPTQSSKFDGAGVQADLDALSVLGTLSTSDPSHPLGFNASGIPYHLPTHAEIRLEKPISLDFRVALEGNGALFRVKNGVDGIIVQSGAGLSSLENFSIAAFSNAQSNSGIGVDVQGSHVRLKNIRITGMGTGIRADGRSGHNVNMQRWQDLIITQSDNYGLYIDGRDANAAMISGLSLSSNKVGIYESGFLGSTYIGNHVEGNEVGIKTESRGANLSTFLGTYIESSDAIEMDPKSLGITTVGGQLSARKEIIGDHIGSQRSKLTFEDRANDLENPDDEHIVRVTIPAVTQTPVGSKVAAVEFSYKFRDCELGTNQCQDLTFPAWKIDRRLDVGLLRDAWEIRPTNATTKRSTFGWSSDSRGNDVIPEIQRAQVCRYLGLHCTP